MATFFDNFNRADSATLGNNWVNIVGTFAITANQAYASTVGANYNSVNTSSVLFTANQSAQVTVSALNQFDRVGPAVRVTANGCYAIRCDGQNDSVERIVRFNGSTATTIGTVNIVPANGDIVRLTAVGNTVSAYINNTLVDTVNIQDANTSNVFTTGQPGLFYSWGDTRKTRLDNFYATDASQIFSVDTDNTIFPGQTNIVISGENLGDVTKANLIFGSKSIDVLGFTSNVSAPTFNLPNIASIKTAGFKFSDVNLALANSSNVIIANTTVTLSLPSGYGIHDVTDLTYSNDPNNMYYGQSPAIAVGDQILYDNSPNIFIDYVGYPEFSNGATSFNYSIYDITYGTWSLDSNVTITQKEINAVSRSFGVRKSGDSKQYSKFPSGRFAPFLLPNRWISSKMPMRIVHPATSTTTTYIYENAYPGMPYNLPVCVQGGAWPFIYELTAAPSGMTIGSTYGSNNYGRIVWTNPTAGTYTVTVKVTDQDASVAIKSWTLSVGTSKHIFFNVTSGNNSTGNGSISNPYKDFQQWANTDYFTKSSNGKIAVYRTGTYSTNSADPVASANTYFMGTNKPCVHMAYPGESVIFNFSSAGWGFVQNPQPEVAIIGVQMQGLNPTIVKYFTIGNSSRTLFDSINFTMINGIPNSNVSNPACIFTPNDIPQDDLAITNCIFDGIDGYFACEIYDRNYVLCENNEIKNAPAKVAGGAFYMKLGDVNSVTIRNNIGTTNNAAKLVFLDSYSVGGTMNSHEVCWNNFKSSSSEGVIVLGNGNGGAFTGRWLYRNTLQAVGSIPCVVLGSGEIINVTLENNIHIHNGAYANGIQQAGYLGTLTQSNQLSLANTTYSNTTGYLTGTYRTDYLGINGWEVA